MNSSPIVQVWDIWVRLFHWSLASSVLFLLFSGSTGMGFFDWHRGVGEFVLLLILFRLLWGVFGSSNARLRPLIRHPSSALAHLKAALAGDSHKERGHNAAGGWAVLMLLLLLSLQAGTGLFIADEDELVEGVFYGMFAPDTTDWIYRMHHTNAELLMVLVAIHVLMVFFYLLRVGQNLIVPMLTGQMSWSEGAIPEVKFATWRLGLVLLAIAYLCIAYVLGWGPIF